MVQNSNNSILFCDYMLNWLKIIKLNIRPTTYGAYKRIINKRIYTYFKNLNITLTELKPIRLHDLRNSLASLNIKNAVHMKDIQVWLGHSSYNTTANLYAHVDKTTSQNSAIVIGNVLSVATA